MRAAFFKALLDAAGADPRVWLVALGPLPPPAARFAERHPDRAVVVTSGAHAALGLAVGLAIEGRCPIVCGGAQTLVREGLEAIREMVVRHRAQLKLVALGAGLGDGDEPGQAPVDDDLALLRAVPDVPLLVPGDPHEAVAAVEQMLAMPGPVYVRLSGDHSIRCHRADVRLEFGRAVEVRAGDALTVLANGSMLAPALQAAAVLARLDVAVRVVSVPSVRPLDREMIAAAVETQGIVTVEEHSTDGGLGSAVAEVVAERMAGRVPVLRLGLPPGLVPSSLDPAARRKQLGLDAGGILERLRELVAIVHAERGAAP